MLIDLLSNKDNTVLECYSPNGKILQETLLYHAPDSIDDKVLGCEYSYYPSGDLSHLVIFNGNLMEKYSYYDSIKQLHKFERDYATTKTYVLHEYFFNGLTAHFRSADYEAYYTLEGSLSRERYYKGNVWDEWVYYDDKGCPIGQDDLIIASVVRSIDAEIKEIVKQDTVVGIEK
jgi:antitoxin component YwqK of YwqJK toxin-antitoxin module